MRLTYTGRHHAWTFCTGDDARDDTDETTPEQRGVSVSTDLTTVDRLLSETEPDARHRTGFTA